MEVEEEGEEIEVEEEEEEYETEEIKKIVPENFLADHVFIPPIYNDAACTDPTLSGAYFHHQRVARTLKNRGEVGLLTAREQASVELVALATRFNLSRECCDAVIRWGERNGSMDLPCFKTMRSVFDRVSDKAAPTELYRSFEIPINPDLLFVRGELLRTSTELLRDHSKKLTGRPLLFLAIFLFSFPHALSFYFFCLGLSIRRQHAPRRVVDQLIGRPSHFDVDSLESHPPFTMPHDDFAAGLRAELIVFLIRGKTPA